MWLAKAIPYASGTKATHKATVISGIFGALQYGLIAEQVAKVYPELVVRDETGRIDGIRYEELAPMLLKELQQQQSAAAAHAERIPAQDRHSAAQDAKLSQLSEHRACVALQADFALTGQSVVEALQEVAMARELPYPITVDHATEFTFKVLDEWATSAV